MKTFLFIFVGLFISYNTQALNFKPFLANPLEPRVGAFYQFDTENLRLDIGTSLDLKTFQLSDSNYISIGADFFTYTRLRTAGNFKFPVETSDYYFGLNTCFSDFLFNSKMQYRVRFAHISSHLVDGLADSVTFRREPFVYSREFIDIAGAYEVFDNFRLYAGVNILYSTKPKDFLLLHPQIGCDYEYPILDFLSLEAGYDFKFAGIKQAMHPVHASQFALRFNTENNIGILLSTYYYSGKSLHGMFFNETDDYFAFGFQVMF